MKHTKAFVIVALAAVAVGGSLLLLRPAESPPKTSDWILQAATALNHATTAGNPHAGLDVGAGDPSSAQQLLIEGQRLRVQRRFAEAQAKYEQAVRADPMNADAWADLADSAASAAGNDLTRGRDAIAHALAIDPQHRKALWLRASLELQEKQFATAAATWRELQALVQPGSPDARVIAANIAEADALAQAALVADGRGS